MNGIEIVKSRSLSGKKKSKRRKMKIGSKVSIQQYDYSSINKQFVVKGHIKLLRKSKMFVGGHFMPTIYPNDHHIDLVYKGLGKGWLIRSGKQNFSMHLTLPIYDGNHHWDLSLEEDHRVEFLEGRVRVHGVRCEKIVINIAQFKRQAR